MPKTSSFKLGDERLTDLGADDTELETKDLDVRSLVEVPKIGPTAQPLLQHYAGL
jgi:hypothetical protein